MLEEKVQQIDLRVVRLETQQSERLVSDAEFKKMIVEEVKGVKAVIIKATGALVVCVLGVAVKLLLKGVL